MTKHVQIFWRFALALVALVALGCAEGTTVAEINRDPGRFRDKQVSITGQVVTSFGAAGEGAYQVDDGTGRIWVLTERGGVPGQGARVRVTGRVTTGVTFAGRSFGVVLRESERQTKSSR